MVFRLIFRPDCQLGDGIAVGIEGLLRHRENPAGNPRRSPRRIEIIVLFDITFNFTGFGVVNLIAEVVVNLVAVVFLRVVAGSNHNAAGKSQMTNGKGKQRNRLCRLHNPYIDSPGRKDFCHTIGIFSGIQTCVIADGDRRMRPALQHIVCNPHGSPLQNDGIDPAGSCSHTSPETGGSEGHVAAEPVKDFLFVVFYIFKLFPQVGRQVF